MASRGSLTEAEWNELHTVVQEPPKFPSRHAQVVADAGLFKKAVRICECGQRMRKRAPDGCISVMIQHCRTWFCAYCGRTLVEEWHGRWNETLNAAILFARAERISQFTFVTLKQPIEEDQEAIKEFFSKEVETMRFMGPVKFTGPDRHRDTTPLLKRTRCHEKGKVDIRILYLNNNLSIADWLALFPKAEVRVWYFDPEQIHEVFKEHLFALYFPQDDEECGRQEVLFDGMQRFAAEGIEMGKRASAPPLSDEALFTEEIEPPVNLPENPEVRNLDCGLGKCKHGYYFNERTRWYKIEERLDSSDPSIWERVPPLPIQH